MPKIFISAGDPSGDVHSARLMEQILKKRHDVEFIGIGGRNMAKLGLKSIAKIEDISVVGFWEVAKRIRYFSKLIDECKRLIRGEQVDLFIPVDYPGFNIKLAQYAKSLSIPTVYFIAPQLWAWGKNRAKKLFNCIDKLLVVFPFEEEFFKQYGLNATFIGHPLLDNPLFQDEPIGFEQREDIVAILPGSRSQEINKHLELFSESAIRFRQANKQFRIIVAKAGDVDLSAFSDYFRQNEIETELGSINLMKRAKLGIVKTGTSNLEAALAGMPFAMAYRTSFFSYLISKRLINLDYISIVNILMNSLIIDELIQNDANPDNIALSLRDIHNNPNRRQAITDSFSVIKQHLGGEGASERAAELILEYLQ